MFVASVIDEIFDVSTARYAKHDMFYNVLVAIMKIKIATILI